MTKLKHAQSQVISELAHLKTASSAPPHSTTARSYHSTSPDQSSKLLHHTPPPSFSQYQRVSPYDYSTVHTAQRKRSTWALHIYRNPSSALAGPRAPQRPARRDRTIPALHSPMTCLNASTTTPPLSPMTPDHDLAGASSALGPLYSTPDATVQ